MHSIRLDFDRAAHSVDAVQRAAYRFSDRCVTDVHVNETTITCIVGVRDRTTADEGLEFDFRNEVLDQTLRARIRTETEAVRNLILSVAFSKTDLAGG
jgi:His-Xaa-Ser system protein HxsD